MIPIAIQLSVGHFSESGIIVALSDALALGGTACTIIHPVFQSRLVTLFGIASRLSWNYPSCYVYLSSPKTTNLTLNTYQTSKMQSSSLCVNTAEWTVGR